MRTRKSILVIMLAFSLVSCQTPMTQKSPVPPQSPVAAQTLGPTAEYVQVEPQPGESQKEVVQSLSTDKTGEKKKGMTVQGKPLPTGLIGAINQEAVIPVGTHAGPAQKIVLNFDKADISEVASQIFGDQLKLNYVVDQGLQGRISMYIEGEFTQQELLQMVTRAFEANGVSVVPKKGMYYIQASAKVGASGLPIADQALLKSTREGVRPLIVIYRLKFMDAKQASNLAAPFISQGKKIATEPLTNSIIFVEETENARSIINLLKTIDINVLQEVSMEIVPLRSISPQDAVQGMETLLNKLGGFKDSAVKNSLAFIPLQTFGGVLVMAQSPDLLKSARQWLQALDIQGVESGEQINVYFIQNGLARDIADILNSVYGLGGTAGGTKRYDQQVVASGKSSTSRSGFGTSSGSFGGSSSFGGSKSSSSSGTSSSTGSTYGSTSGTSGTSSTGTSRGTTGTTGSTGGTFGTTSRTGTGAEKPKIFTGEVTLVADEVNNAIVTRANAADYAKIKKTIETLDLLPRAVLIEVMIAEISLTKEFQFGLKYWFQQNPSSPNGFGISFRDPLGQAAAATTAASSSSTSTTASSLAGSIPFIGAIGGATGLGLGWIAGTQDLAVFINLLSSKTHVNILSNPTLLATDNKDATLTVGGRQPVPTGSYTGTTDTTSTSTGVFSTIQYEETGTILNVTPHINAGGLVRLEVEGIIRRVGANATVGNNNTAPTFTERNFKTTLLAQNGNTVIIGGILNSNEERDKNGIPGLQDIPLIKPLFSNVSRSLDKTELIVAITPHVIDQRESGTSREFLEKMKNLRMRIEQ